MPKTVKEIAELSMKFAENMVNMKRKAIEAGTLEGEELEEAKRIVAEFDELKNQFHANEVNFCSVKKFAAMYTNEIDDRNVLVFAIIRKLVESLADSEGNHDELFDEIRKKLSEYDIEEVALTSTINHVAKLKGLEYSQDDDDCYEAYMKLLSESPGIMAKVAEMEVTPENVLELISNNYTRLLKFSGENKTGLEIVESGIGFIEQIRDRMANAENPNNEEIAEYDKAIEGMKNFVESQKKVVDFSAKMPRFLKKFAESIMATDTICSVLDALSDLDCSLSLESQTESTDTYFLSRNDKTATLDFNKDADGNLSEIIGTSNGESETLSVDNVYDWVVSKLGLDKVEVTVDPETGEVIN